MRWSQPSLFFIFAVLILGEVAISAPIYVDSDIVLEARSPVRTTPVKTRSSTRAQRPATPPPRPPPRPRTPPPRPATSMGRPASPVRAADFKKSSATYRKAALEGDTYHRTSGGLVKSKTGPSLGPGKQADHIVEAQTVANAFNKAGYKKEDLTPKTKQRVKDIVNHPDNMAAISAPLNNLKGAHTRNVLAGGSGSRDPHLAQYTKDTSAKQLKTAQAVTDAFKQGGKSVDVVTAQMSTMNLKDKKKRK